MLKKRMVVVSIIFLVSFFSILMRTSYLHLKDNKSSQTKVTSQISSNSILYYPRGEICDRNGIVLSGRVKTEDISIRDYKVEVGEDVIGKLDIDEDNTTEKGVKGLSGLQLLYDQKLNGGYPIKIAMYSDAKGEKINVQNSFIYGDHLNEGISLKTTLDYHFQSMIEDVLEKYVLEKEYKGASAILSKVKTGEILAMASEGDQTNKGLLCYQPGSLFKILVYGKALEKGVVDMDTVIHCKGSVEIDGVTKKCNKLAGHGEMTIKEAFSQSCNLIAYELASLLNVEDDKGNIIYNEVLELAKEFGFKDETMAREKEFPLSYEYSTPSIPDRIYNSMDVFNLALGQGKVMASPLTITKIISTIANGGVYIEPHLILSETYPLGETIEMKYEGKEIISKEANDKLCILLEEVCKNGTGKENSLGELGGLAGKSGTAQHVSDKKNHGWFTAYFPLEDPLYTVTVFVEEGGYSSDSALPILDTIANKVLELYPIDSRSTSPSIAESSK